MYFTGMASLTGSRNNQYFENLFCELFKRTGSIEISITSFMYGKQCFIQFKM